MLSGATASLAAPGRVSCCGARTPVGTGSVVGALRAPLLWCSGLAALRPVGSTSPNQGSKPHAPHQKAATGPPRKSLSYFKKHQQNGTTPDHPQRSRCQRCAEPSPLSSRKQEKTPLPNPTPHGRCPPSAGRSMTTLLSGAESGREKSADTDLAQQHSHLPSHPTSGSFCTFAPLHSTQQESI